MQTTYMELTELNKAIKKKIRIEKRKQNTKIIQRQLRITKV